MWIVSSGKSVAKCLESGEVAGKQRRRASEPSKRIVAKVSCNLSSAGMEHFHSTRSGASTLWSLRAYLSLINFLSNCPVVVDFDLDNAWIGLFVRPDKAHKSQFLNRHRRVERCKELNTICEIRRHMSLSICHGQTELQVSLSNYSQRDDTTSSDLCDTATSWT